MNEQLIISGGPSAVAAVVARGSMDREELRFLGQACARLSRSAVTYQDALQWSDAAVLCYHEVAKSFEAGYLRHGVEIVQYGIMATMIYKYGSTSPDLRKYLNAIIEWCNVLRRKFTNADEFRAAHKLIQEPAMLLEESLTLMNGLWVKGMLPPEFDGWFFAVGLSIEQKTTST